ncbi:MAG TPA: winged helix-turn-helix domain-containing protein [Candidatus Acidoferrales bacterium]|nr:winged helix-turn-helix domain-containing protein [Candidatus Acidoferrales bacterium]
MTDTAKRKATASGTDSGIHDIGSVAGEIWRYLEANGPQAADTIKRKTKLPSDAFFAGLGWLAREGKVVIDVDGKKIQLALK